MSIIEARPGKEDNKIFESGPNDVTTEQLTDNIEDETESQVGLVNLEILNICSPVTGARIYKT